MLDELTSMILCVPYHMDYTVPQKVRDLLTEKEFFEQCYVNAEFDKEIKRIKAAERVKYDEAEDGTSTWNKEVTEEIMRLKIHRDAEKAFFRWIDDNGNGIFCIKGDAGTGKTTYLHHLKYINKDKNLGWVIIDIQNAHTPIQILSKELKIDKFNLLESKVVAAVLDKIFEILFDDSVDREKTPQVGHEGWGNILRNVLHIFRRDRRREELCRATYLIAKNIEKLYRNYRENVRANFPLEETKWFFDNSPLYEKRAAQVKQEELLTFAETIYRHVDMLMKTTPIKDVLTKLLKVYLILLRSKENDKKYIIAFDNIERNIGDDEISNVEIHELIDVLRHMQDSCYENDHNFYTRFQMIVLMRNTSSRMSGMPLHRIDFWGHELDLGGWFPTDKIVAKKIDWYKTHDIDIEDGELINAIIGEKKGFDGCGPRSLLEKISMLFNHNNRVILSLLSKAISLAHDTNPVVLEVINEFRENKRNISLQLTRFALRSIVMRLILDVLREDGFFKNVIVQVSRDENDIGVLDVHSPESIGQNDEETAHVRLGIARKILSALYEYSLDQGDYMPFDILIQKLNGDGTHHVDEYFDENNIHNRLMIAKILYYMNYYNSRKHNWLHFIDIQCNIPDATEGLRVSHYKKLQELIDERHEIMGIRIMSAGIAYLYYIIQSFEYFSCRVGNVNLLPLLCLIPKLDEIRKCEKVEELSCVSAIMRVKEDAFSCIEVMDRRINSGTRDVLYRRDKDSSFTTHKTRIINAHQGYINNFIDCIKEYYRYDQNVTTDDRKKLNDLYKQLNYLRYVYRGKKTD